jgi:pyrroloquinoline quinone biosynthesis protein D
MTTLADSIVPRFPHGVRFREDKARGTFILVAPERIFNADEVSVEILKRIDGKATLGDILTQLSEIFAADLAVIRPDVESFLIDLQAKQMVTL